MGVDGFLKMRRFVSHKIFCGTLHVKSIIMKIKQQITNMRMRNWMHNGRWGGCASGAAMLVGVGSPDATTSVCALGASWNLLVPFTFTLSK